MAALLREIPLGDVDNAIGLFQDNYEGGCIRAKYTIYALCIFTDRHLSSAAVRETTSGTDW